jgi:hypothetical protein
VAVAFVRRSVDVIQRPGVRANGLDAKEPIDAHSRDKYFTGADAQAIGIPQAIAVTA